MPSGYDEPAIPLGGGPIKLRVVVLALGLAVSVAGLTPSSLAASSPAHPQGKWRVVPSPDVGDGQYLADVSALSPTDAWAVGEYWEAPPNRRILTLVEHWDGSAWTVVPSPNPRYLAGFSGVLTLAPDDVWAVGSSSGKRSLDQTLVEHWDGSSWTVVRSPSPGFASGLYDITRAGSSDTLWAVGDTQPTDGGPYAPLIERWNGARWKMVPAPNPPSGGSLYGVASPATDDAWAVGATGFGDDRALTEHWDGTSWQIVANGTGDRYASLDEVAADSPTDVWAVGADGTKGRPLIEHWDGDAWSVVSSAKGGVALYGVAIGRGGSAWAVGYRTAQGNTDLTFTERWNGTTWSAVSSPNGVFAASDLLAVSTVPGTKQVWAVGISTPKDGSDAASLIELYS